MLTEDLLVAARAIEPRIVALRRAIHAEPELGLETPLTLAKVRAELADVDASSRDPVTGKLNFSHFAARGVMGAELEARALVAR